MLVLARVTATGWTKEGTFPSTQAALDHLAGKGWAVQVCEADTDHPGCWDIFASRGPIVIDTFTLEPEGRRQ